MTYNKLIKYTFANKAEIFIIFSLILPQFGGPRCPPVDLIFYCNWTQMVKNLPGVQETQVRSLGWEDPWRRESLPTPEFFPEQRRLASYNQSIGSQRVRHD